MSITALLIAVGCMPRPSGPPPAVLLEPIGTAVTLEQVAPAREWPDLDVPTWEPAVEDLSDELEVARSLARHPARSDSLVGALEKLEVELEAASCSATAEAPELVEASLALEQGQRVLEDGATHLAPDMLRLVSWVRLNLEAPTRACVTPSLTAQQRPFSDG